MSGFSCLSFPTGICGSPRAARLLAFLLATTALAAQTATAPVVPLDHYGPPSCTAGASAPQGMRPPDPSRMSAAKAIAAEEAGAADATTLTSTAPVENFEIARYRLADYADCIGDTGCYWADLDAQFQRAQSALKLLLASDAHEKKPGKRAVIFDIDETSLSSYCEMKREDFGYITAMSNEWVVKPEASVAVPGAVRLYRQAKAAGLDVFFLTGRPEAQREATARNLQSAGFDSGWTDLFLRNDAERKLTATAYKSVRRGQLVAQGYRIVMNIGDQWSDLNGAPQAELSIKLPNPFYFLP